MVSSALAVRIGDAVYYDSGGSDGKGMELGASQSVLCAAVEHYRDAGCRYFNFGVATPDRPGLSRFKQSFGAEAHDFWVARYDLDRPLDVWVRALREIARG